MRILIVDNDAAIARGNRDALAREDFVIDVLTDGDTARQVLVREAFDVAIVEIDLPGLGGVDVLRRLRREGCRAALLVLSARDSVRDRIAGLDAGADDYLVKSVDPRELRARVRALLRRSTGAVGSEVAFGPLALDTDRHRMRLYGEPVQLRRREFCLLEVLLLHAGKIVSVARITDYIFGYQCDGSPNAVQIYIHRLRKKLALAGISIVTVRGVGYRLEMTPGTPREQTADTAAAAGWLPLAMEDGADRPASATPVPPVSAHRQHDRSPSTSTTE